MIRVPWPDVDATSNCAPIIAVAPSDTLWFGSWVGIVYHLDPVLTSESGKTLTTYTAKDDMATGFRVRAITVTPDSAVWFGTYGWGVSRFDLASSGDVADSWTDYRVKDGLASDYVNAIAVAPDGALWFGTAGGVSRFGPTASDALAKSGNKSKLDNGLGYVASALNSIQVAHAAPHFDDYSWTTYRSGDGLANDRVEAIAVAPDGALWFGTYGGGASRFDGENWTTYTTEDGLAHNDVYAITVAPDGALWFGTYGGGVSRFDGESWLTYTTKDGLPDNIVKAIEVAPDGTLWFGTKCGLARYTPVSNP